MKKNKDKLQFKKSDDLIFVKHKINDDDLHINKEDVSGKKKLDDKEIENNLREIYSEDEKGLLPDFKTIKVKKKKSVFLKFLYFFIFLAILFGIGFSIFKYVRNNRDISSVLKLNISAPEKISLGDDFFYEIEYKNNSNYNLNNLSLEFTYPENFILAEVYSIDETVDNKVWKIEKLGPNLSGKIKIRGKIINKEGSINLLTVKANYGIDGLSSGFSKESLNSVIIGSLPFQITNDFYATVLIDEEYPLKLNFKDFPVNQIDKFVLSFSGPENIFSIKNTIDKNSSSSSSSTSLTKIDDFNYSIAASSSDPFSFNFKYKISERKNDQENVSWILKYIDDTGKEFVFFEKQVTLEIIKSDLNLNISINESSTDTPINFGDTLNYVITYNNKGDKDMKNVVIMAILKSDFLDWKSLKDENGGTVSRKTISWTSKEISDLEVLEPGEGGEIKFSINTGNSNNIEFGQDLKVSSYAQFSIGNIEDFSNDDEHLNDNSSNTIINEFNSDLSIQERVLYFDDDNIPVGSGPLPPVVGEKTSFKYYWTLKNSLHELKDVKVELDLPDYVIWDNNYTVDAGNLNYNLDDNKIVFTISRWPIGIDTVEASFSVSIIPTEAEYNKIIILSPGSSLSAADDKTGAVINKKTEVKTSKLEDDPIANFSSDGRVK
jgi:uncharacterized repeat protein (TIGR01451 family)